MIDWDKYFGKLGGILAFGFGDKLLDGFIPELLGHVGLDDCCDYITQDKDLLSDVPEERWETISKLVKAAKYELTTERVVTQLQKNRPDVLGIIINMPGGSEWLNRQIQNCRQKLGQIS